ncbi:hypothetical protein NQ317_010221, partial [Molorchus minor]
TLLKKNSRGVFGGCEGPDASVCKLISSDGHEFIITCPAEGVYVLHIQGTAIPIVQQKFQNFPIAPEIALELLMALNFLDC